MNFIKDFFKNKTNVIIFCGVILFLVFTTIAIIFGVKKVKKNKESKEDVVVDTVVANLGAEKGYPTQVLFTHDGYVKVEMENAADKNFFFVSSNEDLTGSLEEDEATATDASVATDTQSEAGTTSADTTSADTTSADTTSADTTSADTTSADTTSTDDTTSESNKAVYIIAIRDLDKVNVQEAVLEAAVASMTDATETDATATDATATDATATDATATDATTKATTEATTETTTEATTETTQADATSTDANKVYPIEYEFKLQSYIAAVEFDIKFELLEDGSFKYVSGECNDFVVKLEEADGYEELEEAFPGVAVAENASVMGCAVVTESETTETTEATETTDVATSSDASATDDSSSNDSSDTDKEAAITLYDDGDMLVISIQDLSRNTYNEFKYSGDCEVIDIDGVEVCVSTEKGRYMFVYNIDGYMYANFGLPETDENYTERIKPYIEALKNK